MNAQIKFNKILSEKGYTDHEHLRDIFTELAFQVIEKFDYKVLFDTVDFVVNKDFDFTEQEAEKLELDANEYFLTLAEMLGDNINSYVVLSKNVLNEIQTIRIIPYSLTILDFEDAKNLLALKEQEEELNQKRYSNYKVTEYLLVKYSDLVQ